jgi:phosphoglucosamine mutase
MGQFFGTDGVRGIANVELTNELSYRLGRAGAFVLSKGVKKARIIIGKDTRISGDMLESSLVAGILSAGCEVIKAGVLPTPAIAYLVRHFGFEAGVMISASHNPAEYNGIKFFNGDGLKLSDEVEEEIEKYLVDGSDIPVTNTGIDIGTKTEIYNACDIYEKHIKSTLTTGFEGMKVAIDAANGAAYEVASKTFRDMGAEVVVINNIPDGVNINDNCGSTHMDGLKELVLKSGSHIGLAFDGDADRLLAIDEKGRFIDGDRIMNILAKGMKRRGELTNDTVVATVMSNIGLEMALRESGISVVKTKVGDRYVLEEMLNKGYAIGGEQSGHIIMLRHNTTGDGLLTACCLVQEIAVSGRKASELYDDMESFPQVLRNARVKNENKKTYMENEAVAAKISEIEDYFKGSGRVLIRPSGTEPLVRVMIEGKDQSVLDKFASELASLIEENLG